MKSQLAVQLQVFTDQYGPRIEMQCDLDGLPAARVGELMGYLTKTIVNTSDHISQHMTAADRSLLFDAMKDAITQERDPAHHQSIVVTE